MIAAVTCFACAPGPCACWYMWFSELMLMLQCLDSLLLLLLLPMPQVQADYGVQPPPPPKPAGAIPRRRGMAR